MTRTSNLIPGGADKRIPDGRRVMLTLPPDVHEYIRKRGGSKWLVELIRNVRAANHC